MRIVFLPVSWNTDLLQPSSAADALAPHLLFMRSSDSHTLTLPFTRAPVSLEDRAAAWFASTRGASHVNSHSKIACSAIVCAASHRWMEAATITCTSITTRQQICVRTSESTKKHTKTPTVALQGHESSILLPPSTPLDSSLSCCNANAWRCPNMASAQVHGRS